MYPGGNAKQGVITCTAFSTLHMQSKPEKCYERDLPADSLTHFFGEPMRKTEGAQYIRWRRDKVHGTLCTPQHIGQGQRLCNHNKMASKEISWHVYTVHSGTYTQTKATASLKSYVPNYRVNTSIRVYTCENLVSNCAGTTERTKLVKFS